MKRVLLCLLLLAAVAVAADDDSLIRTASRDLDAALASGNVDEAVRHIASDATFHIPGAPAIHGHPAIRQFVAGLAASGRKFSAETTALWISGDLAVETQELTMTAKRPDGTEFQLPGKAVNVWRRVGGKWQLALHAPSNDGTPPRNP